MHGSDANYRHLVEDIAGIAAIQALSAVVTIMAVVLFGANFIGIATEYGGELNIPYSGAGVFVVGAAAMGIIGTMPARYRFVWTDPQARNAIMIGLGQILVTAAAIAATGYFLAGAWFGVTTPGQSMIAWLYYGLIVAGAAQAAVAIAALVLLLLKRDLPDVVD
jgi:hypothetical protein